MRSRVAMFLVLLAMAAGPAAAAGPSKAPAQGAAKGSSRIRPVAGADSVMVQMGKKKSPYYVITSARPLEFQVDGPTPVRLQTRLLFTGAPPAKGASYGLVVEIDGVKTKTVKEKTGAAKHATTKDGAVGALKTVKIAVPAGSHRVRVSVSESGASVAARLLRGEKQAKKKVGWTPFTPDGYEKVARLHSRDTEETYYRFSARTPVSLALNGPARMRIITRLDFGQTRGYSQNYAVKTELDGKPWKTFSYQVRASHIAQYPELDAITPGMPETSALEVPSGRHQIAVQLDCTTAESASVRILIPRSAIKNSH